MITSKECHCASISPTSGSLLNVTNDCALLQAAKKTPFYCK